MAKLSITTEIFSTRDSFVVFCVRSSVCTHTPTNTYCTVLQLQNSSERSADQESPQPSHKPRNQWCNKAHSAFESAFGSHLIIPNRNNSDFIKHIVTTVSCWFLWSKLLVKMTETKSMCGVRHQRISPLLWWRHSVTFTGGVRYFKVGKITHPLVFACLLQSCSNQLAQWAASGWLTGLRSQRVWSLFNESTEVLPQDGAGCLKSAQICPPKGFSQISKCRVFMRV